MDSMEVYAGKVVSKSLLLKPHQRDKASISCVIHHLCSAELVALVIISMVHVRGYNSFSKVHIL